MSELAFLAVGLLALFGLGVPLFTLVSKVALVLRWRRAEDITDFGSTPGYLLIVSPVLLPVLWVVSAGLHQTENGWSALASGSGARHLAGQACWNALVLGLVATLVVAVVLLRTRLRLGATKQLETCESAAHHRASRRITRVCRSHPTLARLRRRIRVVHRAGDQAVTTGLLRPVIEMSCGLIHSLDDRALQGALLHEAEHVRGLDPLRYLLARVALSLNPFGWLLASEFQRWRWAREARCDRGAVSLGASPLSLAQALLVAARQSTAGSVTQPALARGESSRFLRLRILLLLGYASTFVTIRRRILPVLAGAVAVVLLTAWLPHAVSAWPLDGLHELVDATCACLPRI